MLPFDAIWLHLRVAVKPLPVAEMSMRRRATEQRVPENEKGESANADVCRRDGWMGNE